MKQTRPTKCQKGPTIAAKETYRSRRGLLQNQKGPKGTKERDPMYRQKRHNTGVKETPIPKHKRDAYTK